MKRPVPLREYLRPGKWRHAARRRWFRTRLAHGIPVQPWPGVVKVGSGYGGWLIPLAEVRPDWIVYSVGAGTDVSFDLGLIAACGCDVHAFDPTPEAIEYLHEIREPRLHLHPWALWTVDADIPMYVPRVGSGSLSAVNLQATAETIMLPARSLRSIMAELRHDRIDLLKLDIEGAEYEVVTPELVAEAGVRILAIDVHPHVPARRGIAFLQALIGAGYQVIAREETDFTLVRDDRAR